jgi:hypothetical protein
MQQKLQKQSQEPLCNQYSDGRMGKTKPPGIVVNGSRSGSKEKTLETRNEPTMSFRINKPCKSYAANGQSSAGAGELGMDRFGKHRALMLLSLGATPGMRVYNAGVAGLS